MENTSSKTSPKDFFLWLGAIIALYGSVSLLITLLFEYINYVYPDPLAYAGDPYGGVVRFAMSGLIVLVPALIILMRFIRSGIEKEPGKATIWVRRWAIMLTVFLALLTALIDLITVLNTFLGGEGSERFFLKAAVVLLIALGVFLHFMADFKGYWITHSKKANLVGIGVGILTIFAIVSGFFIIGTPSDIRMLRYDEQKVQDLQNIQYQVLNYWQLKEQFPKTLTELADPLSGSMVPVDPQESTSYRYEVTGPLSFKLCASFNKESPDMTGRGSYPSAPSYAYDMGMGDDSTDTWKHGVGEVCFERTIDPERYPPYGKGL